MNRRLLMPVMACLMLVNGCTLFLVGTAAAVGVGVGAASVAYIRGDLEVNTKGTPRDVKTAAERGLRNMDMLGISGTATAVDARVTGYTSDETKVTVMAKSNDVGITKITIRIGVLGDENLSRRIYREMSPYLPEGVPQ